MKYIIQSIKKHVFEAVLHNLIQGRQTWRKRKNTCKRNQRLERVSTSFISQCTCLLSFIDSICRIRLFDYIFIRVRKIFDFLREPLSNDVFQRPALRVLAEIYNVMRYGVWTWTLQLSGLGGRIYYPPPEGRPIENTLTCQVFIIIDKDKSRERDLTNYNEQS